MVEIYAIGWQVGRGKSLGKLKNFRKVISDEASNYIGNIQFANNQNSNESTLTLKEKFEESIESLQNVETNGNNTEVPFYRKIDESLQSEIDRIQLVSSQLETDLPPLKNFEDIRLYLVCEEIDGVQYKYFLKSIRVAKLKTRFIATLTSGKVKIVDIEKDEGRSLPFIISYAEKTENNETIQYIFDVQDYEIMFGLNESKIITAEENYKKFLSHNFKLSTDFKVKVSDEESEKIKAKLKSHRKLINLLAKYNDEASSYEWKCVKRANKLSAQFFQTPFTFNEKSKEIYLTAESLEAFISVITNAKKLGIAKNEYEDSLADKRQKDKKDNIEVQ
ncbi:hypothetical protein RK851_10570 [Streptococcus pneumoniae]|uniref:Uncharacterized protein n=1 Tax=Streptococcus pneumoniae TaxID=1313 RepID=A0A064C690_STREE|nr:hypothetical protein [Streptococcus pneumoniae]EPD21316.1 hypothetical protein SP6UMMC_02647 [Streptococcus pneumoniae MNZ41]ETE03191.1 hypothetical protein U756_01260 [Streptococcus pneumoniae 27]OYL06008.1 hypothetical protein AK86_11340 [Streptococcus pneumoniae B1599]OYL12966.1 hypothetical protein AK85_00165 [Streptococcus pneumoniae B1598]AJD72731.1 hypothetical protein SpnNT_01798 [Streptococcus pneumoniae]